MDLKEKIKAEMRENSISAAELARAAHCDRSTIYKKMSIVHYNRLHTAISGIKKERVQEMARAEIARAEMNRLRYYNRDLATDLGWGVRKLSARLNGGISKTEYKQFLKLFKSKELANEIKSKSH